MQNFRKSVDLAIFVQICKRFSQYHPQDVVVASRLRVVIVLVVLQVATSLSGSTGLGTRSSSHIYKYWIATATAGLHAEHSTNTKNIAFLGAY